MEKKEGSKEKTNKLLDYFRDEIFPVPIMHNNGTPLDEMEFIKISESLNTIIGKMEKKDKEND